MTCVSENDMSIKSHEAENLKRWHFRRLCKFSDITHVSCYAIITRKLKPGIEANNSFIVCRLGVELVIWANDGVASVGVGPETGLLPDVVTVTDRGELPDVLDDGVSLLLITVSPAHIHTQCMTKTRYLIFFIITSANVDPIFGIFSLPHVWRSFIYVNFKKFPNHQHKCVTTLPCET